MTGLRAAHADSSTVEKCLELICRAFELDIEAARPLFDADPYYRLEDKWLLWDGDRAVSTATIIPCRIHMGGWEMPCAGVAGVATDPGLRGRGYATALLTELLRVLPSRGYAAAALLAATTGLYERLGFVEAARRWALKFELPEIPGLAFPRDLGIDDRRDVVALHGRFGAHRLGALVRDEQRWRYLFWRNQLIVGAGRPVEQYMVYAASVNGVFVRELLPPGPLEPMLRFLAGKGEIEVQGWWEDVELWRAAVAPWCDVGEPESSSDGILMWRVIDPEMVVRALSQLQPEIGAAIADVPVGPLSRALALGSDAVGQLGVASAAQGLLPKLLPRKRVFSLFPCDTF